MNASGGSPAGPSIIGWIFRLILVGVSVYFIYWAYKKLYEGPADSTVIMKDIHKADTDTGKPAILVGKDKLPFLFEGGEYSISMWMYVNGWANANRYLFNKDVLALGNLSGNMTLGIYLDSRDNVLHVRTGSMIQSGSDRPTPSFTGADYEALFRTSTTPSAGADTDGDCMISPFALQRWVHVVVTLSGKTVDVYIDGKLSRSCVQRGLFTADPSYALRVAGNNGFAGFVSGVKAFAYALNPEEVYRTYMAGPLGAVSWTEYVKSLFDPKAIGTLDYPKMNA
jgi:hypothetical protein